MKRGALIGVVFLGAVVLAVAGWVVSGARWLVTAPVRGVRGLAGSAGRVAG